MKKLILVRHGDYVGSALTDYGRKQMQKLAPALARYVVGNMYFVTSPIERAKESAAILAEYFKVPVFNHRIWSAEGNWSNNEGAFQYIDYMNTSIDTFVVVTHLPFLESFPAYFGKKALDVLFHNGGVNKGQAQVIDCQMKTMTCVRPSLSEY